MFKSKKFQTPNEKRLATRTRLARDRKFRRGVNWFWAITAMTVFSASMYTGYLVKIEDSFSEPVFAMQHDTMSATKEKAISIKDYVFSEVENALGRDEAIKAVIMIGGCENKAWNPDKITNEPDHTVSLGIWQINSIHKDISNAGKLDYKLSTAWSIKKRIHDGNWYAWTCGRNK